MEPRQNQAQQLKSLATLAGDQQREANAKAALAASQVTTQAPPTIIIQQPKG